MIPSLYPAIPPKPMFFPSFPFPASAYALCANTRPVTDAN